MMILTNESSLFAFIFILYIVEDQAYLPHLPFLFFIPQMHRRGEHSLYHDCAVAAKLAKKPVFHIIIHHFQMHPATQRVITHVIWHSFFVLSPLAFIVIFLSALLIIPITISIASLSFLLPFIIISIMPSTIMMPTFAIVVFPPPFMPIPR